MRKTNIYLGIIFVMIAGFYITAFADNGPSGDSGMLSAGEMRAAIKSGGSFTSQSNVLSGGTQVRYGGNEQARSAPITNANTINNLNTKGHSGGPGGTVILSGTKVNNIVSNAMSSKHGSMDRAVNALKSHSNAVAQHLNLPVNGVNSQISAGGVNVPAYGSHLAMPAAEAAAADAWLAAGGNKAKVPVDGGTGGVKKPFVSVYQPVATPGTGNGGIKTNSSGNVYLPEVDLP